VRLAPEAAQAGYRLRALGATGSTNDDALAAAREGDPGLLWVTAAEQLSGRGRHGRGWASPPGNLHASLLLVDPCGAAQAPQLGFVAGLALHEAVAAVTGAGAPTVALKWPNDLLVGGAKAAGLLLEGHRIGAALAVVVGFGVNVAAAPAGTPYPAAALQVLRPGLGAAELFEALSGAFARSFAAWQAGAGTSFGTIRSRWLERAAGLGAEVRLRLPSGERRGVFQGLDGSGRLQLKTVAGLELIDAGDLYFPNLRSGTAALHPSSG